MNSYKKLKVYDVSVSLSEQTPVFPSQPRFKRQMLSEITKGDRANVSLITMTTHTGTHVDSPHHFIADGKTIDSIDALNTIGPCKVFMTNNDKQLIDVDFISQLDIKKGDIVLFKTKNSSFWDDSEFNNNYVYITPEAAELLVQLKVVAVGVDYIIPEKQDDLERPVHHKLLGAGILIIEGLNFTNVPEGDYLLICLPLKIQSGDAGPARAFLIDGDLNKLK